MPVESGLQSALNREGDDTRCCYNTICPPENEHSTARNMFEDYKVTYIYCHRIRELCIKLVT